VTTFEAPPSELIPVALEPQGRTTLKGAQEQAQAHHDRLSLGWPSCIELDMSRVDDEAKVFLAARPASRFFLLALTASFAPDDENPLESAWVDVQLSTDSPAGTEDPVAWSMKPSTSSDPVSETRKVSIDASLKLVADLGVQAGKERTISFERRAVTVEALREGTRTPGWTFYATEVGQIRGAHHLFLIIDMAAGSTGTATISVGATLRLRRLRVFRYRATLEHLPEMSRIALPPLSFVGHV